MHVTSRIPRRVAPRFGPLAAALLGVAALLAAACGGEQAAPPPSIDSTASPTAEPASEATSTVQPPTATAPPVTAAPRDDGLTGAPVPPPTVRSAEYDAGLVNARGGAFPPLDFPAVVPASEADWMADDDLVLGAVQNGAARAYPIFMLRFHHVANDELGGEPYLVTF